MSMKVRIELFILGAIGIILLIITNDIGSLVARDHVIMGTCGILIVFSLIAKPIVKGNVIGVDLIRVNGYKEKYEKVDTLKQESVKNICNILAKKTACLHFTDDFLYKYALQIHTNKKDYYIYVNSNNISELKITKYCFGLMLNDNEKMVLAHIIEKAEKAEI